MTVAAAGLDSRLRGNDGGGVDFRPPLCYPADMQNFAQLPAVLWRMAGDFVRAAVIGAAVPLALATAGVMAIILVFCYMTGAPLLATTATVLGNIPAATFTPLSLLAVIPLALGALAGLSQWGLSWYKLLQTPAGRNWLLPAYRRMAWLRRLAGHCLLMVPPPGPRRITPALALSPAQPHRAVRYTAAALAGAIARRN